MTSNSTRRFRYPEDPRFTALLGKHGDDIVTSSECRRRLQNRENGQMPTSSFTNMRYTYPETFPEPVWPVPEERETSSTPSGGRGPYWYLWSEIKDWWRKYLRDEIQEVRREFRDGGWRPVKTGAASTRPRYIPVIFAQEMADFKQRSILEEMGIEVPMVDMGAITGNDVPKGVSEPAKPLDFPKPSYPDFNEDGDIVGVDEVELLDLDDVALGKLLRIRMEAALGPFTIVVKRNGTEVAEYDNVSEKTVGAALVTAALRAEAGA